MEERPDPLEMRLQGVDDIPLDFPDTTNNSLASLNLDIMDLSEENPFTGYEIETKHCKREKNQQDRLYRKIVPLYQQKVICDVR